jgi:hypothetical protein
MLIDNHDCQLLSVLIPIAFGRVIVRKSNPRWRLSFIVVEQLLSALQNSKGRLYRQHFLLQEVLDHCVLVHI